MANAWDGIRKRKMGGSNNNKPKKTQMKTKRKNYRRNK